MNIFYGLINRKNAVDRPKATLLGSQKALQPSALHSVRPFLKRYKEGLSFRIRHKLQCTLSGLAKTDRLKYGAFFRYTPPLSKISKPKAMEILAAGAKPAPLGYLRAKNACEACIFWVNYFLWMCIFICLTLSNIFAQVEEQSVGEAKQSTEGSYNFYNTKTKEKTGFSQRRRKDIVYYDRHGKIIGTLKEDKRHEGSYNYYNAEGVRLGKLRKKPTGSYMYMNTSSGKIVEASPLNRKEVGSLSPETFISNER